MEQLQAFMSIIELTEADDFLEWCPYGVPSSRFISSQIYNLVRNHKPQVSWHRTVLFKRGIPKHNTLTWMVNLNRCPNKDRLISRNIQVDPNCLFCNTESESRDHLFFNCTFSSAIWSSLSTKLRLPSYSLC